MKAIYILPAVMLGFGLWLILSAVFLKGRSFSGGRYRKWENKEKDIWQSPFLDRLTVWMSRFVYLDDSGQEKLARQLDRAGLNLSPKEFTARKYVIVAFAVISIAICAALKFWLGVLLFGLLAMLLFMKQKEELTSRLKVKDDAIAMEMPRFVRTICRTLRSNRDINAAMTSYRKVAGPELGAELDILLTHLRTGGVTAALQQFQRRIGTEDASRLCSTLYEIDRGVDQTATLDYLADDMARQAKYRIEKTLALRPAKMRRTYLPAVGVCVVLIIYVLIVFCTVQLNNLF